MRKNMKTLGALACAGVLGLGAIGNTAMVANAAGQGDTNVYYTSDSTNIDQDGKIVMIIPADVNLNKNKTTGETTLKLKTSNGQTFNQFGAAFSAKNGVSSANSGKLKAGNIEAVYNLQNSTENIDADWTKNNDSFATFNNAKDNTVAESTRNLTVSVEDASVQAMEAAPTGTQFKDVLTFKVTSLAGDGLTMVTTP